MNSVVFFGSGPVAAKSLQLLTKHCMVEAVITKQSTETEMKAVTGAPVYTVHTKQELDTLVANNAFKSLVAVLIDFGIIVSQTVIDYFPKGIINSHFSLLPRWRGADPITFALLSGQSQTGVSLMLLVEKMDEGPLLAQRTYTIKPEDTSITLTEELIALSDILLQEHLSPYLGGRISPISQTEAAAQLSIPNKPTYSRKLTKQDGIIDWTKPAEQIEREIRAFIVWPKSRTLINDLDVVITSSKVIKQQIEPCGKFWVANKQLFVSCGKDSLEILSLKPSGKKEMPAKAFLAGYADRLRLN